MRKFINAPTWIVTRRAHHQQRGVAIHLQSGNRLQRVPLGEEHEIGAKHFGYKLPAGGRHQIWTDYFLDAHGLEHLSVL